MPDTLTLLDDGRVVELPATFTGDGARLRPDDITAALGWELKAQGLCRGEVCIPVRERAELDGADGVDLAAFARVLGRPLAFDAAERVAYLGASADERAAQLASLQAPQFALPDLDGRAHTLSDYRGRKILLVAYASW